MKVCPIIQTPNLNSPGNDKLQNTFQPADLDENISFTVQVAFVGPWILDDIVFFETMDMPAYGSPTTENEIVEDPMDDFIHFGLDLNSTRVL